MFMYPSRLPNTPMVEKIKQLKSRMYKQNIAPSVAISLQFFKKWYAFRNNEQDLHF